MILIYSNFCTLGVNEFLPSWPVTSGAHECLEKMLKVHRTTENSDSFR